MSELLFGSRRASAAVERTRSASAARASSTGRLSSAETRERVAADGRWGGSITHHALPDSREELAAMAPTQRAWLARIWRSQAATEARVASSFAVIEESLEALGADSGLVRLAARAVDDERRHAALCEEASGRYAGAPCAQHERLEARHPRHPHASPELRRALYVVGQCALNETFASAYLAQAYRGATSPLARAVIRELLEDEIDHARLGWAFLSTTSASTRRELSRWLVVLTESNLREWRRIDLPDSRALEAHGVPPRGEALDALDEAVRGVLLPGFAHAGLDTRGLERWLSRGGLARAA